MRPPECGLTDLCWMDGWSGAQKGLERDRSLEAFEGSKSFTCTMVVFEIMCCALKK